MKDSPRLIRLCNYPMRKKGSARKNWHCTLLRVVARRKLGVAQNKTAVPIEISCKQLPEAGLIPQHQAHSLGTILFFFEYLLGSSY